MEIITGINSGKKLAQEARLNEESMAIEVTQMNYTEVAEAIIHYVLPTADEQERGVAPGRFVEFTSSGGEACTIRHGGAAHYIFSSLQEKYEYTPEEIQQHIGECAGTIFMLKASL